MATHPTFYFGSLKPYRPAGLLSLRSRLRRRVLTEGVRHHPIELFRGNLGRSRNWSWSRQAACLSRLQAAHTVIQSPNPVEVLAQTFAHRSIALLALRTPVPQAGNLVTGRSLTRSRRTSKSQRTFWSLSTRTSTSSTKRGHVCQLAIQQPLTSLHISQEALQIRVRASRVTLHSLVGHHSAAGFAASAW
ncbi:hypothetical protein PR003_g25276 [Phytophthora rubi]|uniref:Uncharacterized protein n=1 Tax=Phytophthora rubi TaxID=129364 RepID=A0A6A4CFI2_9STRA|nr:hypothetical protein PR003_g25276 [Phytophthora rubi]